MSGNSAVVLALALGGLILSTPVLSTPAVAQLTPPAGSAGAGNTPISGIPFGPANPRALSDPSGYGNAATIPPLRSNTPPPPTSYGSVYSSSPPPRVVAAPYAGGSQRIISAYSIGPRRHAPGHRRGRAQVSTFTGICRGC
jgi:hypothetical protein